MVIDLFTFIAGLGCVRLQPKTYSNLVLTVTSTSYSLFSTRVTPHYILHRLKRPD